MSYRHHKLEHLVLMISIPITAAYYSTHSDEYSRTIPLYLEQRLLPLSLGYVNTQYRRSSPGRPTLAHAPWMLLLGDL
jgi:hypothetical protein